MNSIDSDAKGHVQEISTSSPSLELQYPLEEYFQINETCTIIKKHNFKRVALQFPDNLLTYAPQLSTLITKQTNAQTYILADTSYGTCCVDEVASQHVNSDFLIHYGPSCLSKTERNLPVFYAFGKKRMDIESLLEFCELNIEKKAKLFLQYDVVYHHLLADIQSRLGDSGFDVVSNDIQVFQNKLLEVDDSLSVELSTSTSDSKCSKNICPCSNESKSIKDSDKSAVTQSECSIEPLSINNLELNTNSDIQTQKITSTSTILYIGKDSPSLSHLLMIHSQTKIYTFDPDTLQGTLESPQKNNLLLKRYAKINACIKSDTIAIVVGTLGVKSYIPLIKQLKHLIRKMGKSCHVVSVGKPNPAKLGNFDSVGCFVFIGCPVSTVMIGEDSKEYIKPILTPFELFVGLSSLRHVDGEKEEGDLSWAPYADGDLGKYEMDFTEIATRIREQVDLGIDNSGNGDGVVMVNGCKELIQFGNSVTFLNERTFKGLDKQTDLIQPALITKGRSGLARDYDGNASDQ